MTPNDFVVYLVTEKLVSQDAHIIQRVKDLAEENFSKSVVLASLSDEELESEAKARFDAKQKAAEVEKLAIEEKEKADKEAADWQEKADEAATESKAKQDRIDAIASATAKAVAEALAQTESEAK